MKAPPEDNARPEDLGPEPTGFWSQTHAQVRAMIAAQEDDGAE